MTEGEWACRSCGVALEKKKIVFEYLGHTVSHELPVCPRCGRALISSQLAAGKISEVEMLFEDK